MLKKLLMDSWLFFRNHAVALSLIILPIVVPIDILTALYQYFLASEEYVLSEKFAPMIVDFVVYPIYAGGIVFYIASVITGEKIGTKTAWGLGAKFWLPYLIMNILVGVAVMFGLILLVIPGIIIAVRYAFSEFDLLLNQSQPLDAMRNSWDLTKKYAWILLGGYIIITLVLYAPYYMLASLFDETSFSYWVLDTASTVVYSVLGAMYTIFAFRVYEHGKIQHNRVAKGL